MDGGEDQPAEDPFDGLHLDEHWIAGAEVSEPSARTRSTRAEVRELEAARKAQVRATERRARRRRTLGRVAAAGGLLLFIGAVAVANDDGDNALDWASGADLTESQPVTERPTPRPGESDEPLGTPAQPHASAGTFAFIGLQRDDETPVAYDPCRTIHVVVNERTMPEGAAGLVDDALATVSKVSGLQFEVEGPTDEDPGPSRKAVQQDRYGDRWAPVLIAWSDPDEESELADEVVGATIGQWAQVEDGPKVYVTGQVMLDGPHIEQILDEDEGTATAKDVILHELGHLVGLDHVDDAHELMYPESQPDLHGLQRGDRAGLTKLGQGACVDRL